MPYIDVLH